MNKVTEYSEELGSTGLTYTRVTARDSAPFFEISSRGAKVVLSFAEASRLSRFIDTMEVVWGPALLEKFK